MKGEYHVNRRAFIRTSALFTSGLVVSFMVPAANLRKSVRSSLFSPNAFLRIDENGVVTIVLSKVEMGQGVWTTLPMLIAEELDCDWSAIRVEHSPASEAYAGTMIPSQKTVGSNSVVSEFDRYRYAGATAREMLVSAAAKRLGVQREACTTANGFVVVGEKRIPYGELAEEASGMPVPEVKLRDPKEWKYIGKAQRRLDGRVKVNGEAVFGIDIHFPGLLTAVVAHPPTFGGTVRSYDATAARAVRGVVDVVQVPSGIAVVAETFWSATVGRNALKVEWNTGLTQYPDTSSQLEGYRTMAKTPGRVLQHKGEVDAALKESQRILEAEYTLPYLAHAPMEPLNCTVKIDGGRCEIWTGTQFPGDDQAAAAKVLGLQPDQVTLHTPFIGAAFGRRGAYDSHWVVEAVHVARQTGKPVKLMWTREDDIRGGYYRPACVHHVTIGLDAEGLPKAWRHRVVGQSVMQPFMGDIFDESSVEGIKGSPYLESCPHQSIELHVAEVGVPVLPWRSVGFSQTCFVMETMIDEIAFMTKTDPVAYRRRVFKDHPRQLTVLDLVTQQSHWNEPLAKGRYRGIAMNHSHGSYVAQAIEISIRDDKLKIHRVVCAIDCGLAVNPDGVKAQMEGAIIFGLTAALYGEITLERGQVVQSNFHNYRMVRMKETPAIEVVIAEGSLGMGGAGEPGVPPVAPALANAIFAATGKRIRALPIGNSFR